MDYPTIRSNFIEENLLTPWCNTHSQSQIVLLGAGLDTRAYRFEPLQINQNIVFEIDFPIVFDHKEKVMQKKRPLCKVVRLSADLIEPSWSSHLIKKGFSKEIPTFWIMEGLVYYLEQDEFFSLINNLAELSKNLSQIFIDVFSMHPKWDLNVNEIPEYFKSIGWEVSISFVKKNDQDREVSQKGMVFIKGIKK